MPVIGTSGSTSGDGKRRVAAWPKRPRPSSTLPAEMSGCVPSGHSVEFVRVGGGPTWRSSVREPIDLMETDRTEYAEMTNVLVTFYSTYGHIHQMALAVAKGAESVPDSTVRLRRIAELEEARKALSAQDAYVRAQQAQADIPL